MSAPITDPTLYSQDGARAPAEPTAVTTGVSRFAATSRALRGAGSLALLAALSTFLVQHWQQGSDLWRAATLLAHTVALAGAGLFCGLGARDGKAARTFLGLAGASLPIVSCVGGALLYSQLAWDAGPVDVAGYATWVAPSPLAALGAAAVALACSVPVAVLALGSFARRQMGLLAAAFVAANALLFVPTRDPDAIAVLAGLALAAAAALELRVLRRDPAMATFEGGLARTLVLAPVALLVARSALHYALSPLFHAVLWHGVAAALFAGSLARSLPEPLRGLPRWAAVVPAAWAALALADALHVGPALGLGLPVAAGAFALQLGAASLLAGDEGWGREFRALAGLGFAGACVANLAFERGVAASLVAGAASIGALAWGTLRESRALQVAGAAGALAAVAVHVRHAIALYEWSRWGSLALLGVAVIVAASLVERFGPRALARVERWKRGLAPEA